MVQQHPYTSQAVARMVVGGDVCPIGRAMPLLEQRAARQLFGDLLDELLAADLALVNLECALTEAHTPIFKDGPALKATAACAAGLRSCGIEVVNLANNHILDFGQQGLRETRCACSAAGIASFGAGDNLEEAGRILIREMNGVRIGLLGMAEHEFTIAGNDLGGANPIDPIEFVRKVMSVGTTGWDVLVVCLHGGKEHYPYPNPSLMKTCRFLVEAGARAVVCQHSHCAGCYEIYKGAPIVYGQGNLIFDAPNKKHTWHEGFLVQLELDRDLCPHLSLVPYVQFADEAGVRRMQGEQRFQFLAAVEERSQQIQSEEFVRQRWLQFCREHKYTYFSRLYGHNRLLRVLNRSVHFSDWLYRRETALMVRNVVECETHREVLETLWREG